MRRRQSVRGVVFNAAGDVILLRCEDSAPVDPRNPEILRYWVTPGGGTRTGETAEQSLARELHEEAGLVDVEIGSCVWVRELELHLKSGPVMSHESYFVCRSGQTQLSSANMTANERNIIKDVRWWTLDQLAASEEMFRPPGFVSLVQSLAAQGVPPEPIRIEG